MLPHGFHARPAMEEFSNLKYFEVKNVKTGEVFAVHVRLDYLFTQEEMTSSKLQVSIGYFKSEYASSVLVLFTSTSVLLDDFDINFIRIPDPSFLANVLADLYKDG